MKEKIRQRSNEQHRHTSSTTPHADLPGLIADPPCGLVGVKVPPGPMEVHCGLMAGHRSVSGLVEYFPQSRENSGLCRQRTVKTWRLFLMGERQGA